MARIAGVDLPRTKRIEIGLTYIYGIGRKRSGDIDVSEADRLRNRERLGVRGIAHRPTRCHQAKGNLARSDARGDQARGRPSDHRRVFWRPGTI